MEIQPINENEDFYFCQIINENGATFNCTFRKLSNFLKKDLYDRKCILESCSKLDAENNVVLKMYGSINIYFSPSLYSYISVKKNGNERIIWFGYKSGDFYVGSHEFIKSDAISHSKYGYYTAIASDSEDCLAKDLRLYVDKYFTSVPLFYNINRSSPIQLELDSSCPSNEEILEILNISKIGPKIADIFTNTKSPLNRIRENKDQ